MQSRPPGALTIRSSRQTYGLVVTVVVAILVTGLLIPFVFGDPASTIIASGGPGLPGTPAGSSGGEIPSATTAPGGATPATSPQGGPATTGTAAASPTNTPPGGPGPANGGPLTASDVGVTESTITVGVVLLDLDAVAPLGLGLDNFSVETQRDVFQAYIDDINARGGINGRQVVAAYVRNDPLDAGAARARCVELAQDHEVFAVLGFITDEVSCLVQEQRRPSLGYTNYPRAAYEQSGQFLVTGQPSSERVAANWAGALEDLGALQGHTIGIVAHDDPEDGSAADSLQSTLEQLGHEVTYRSRLSMNADTAVSQIPIEVQRMRQAGVDLVLLPTNFYTARTWVENAASQGWTPEYSVSEIGQLTSDALVENMPEAFDGSIAIVNATGGLGQRSVRAGEPERPENRTCRELYNSASDGHDFEYGEENPIGSACPIVQIFERAAVAAGPNLTRDGFVAAIQSLGAFALPTFPGGHFAPGKTDYNDTIQPIRWTASCRCYDVAGPLMPGRY